VKRQIYKMDDSRIGLQIIPFTNTFAFPENECPIPVTIPSLECGYEFRIGALFLKPTSGALDYAIYTMPFPILTPNWQVQSINPHYRTGF